MHLGGLDATASADELVQAFGAQQVGIDVQAVLVKSGAFKLLWKAIIALGIAGSAFIKKIIASIKKFFSRDKAGLES